MFTFNFLHVGIDNKNSSLYESGYRNTDQIPSKTSEKLHLGAVCVYFSLLSFQLLFTQYKMFYLHTKNEEPVEKFSSGRGNNRLARNIEIFLLGQWKKFLVFKLIYRRDNLY